MRVSAGDVVDCRLLPFVVAAGAWQMAADEVLLESAAAEGIASLRVYGWSEPTLSLGYFQPAASRFVDPLLAALTYVRRASGGGALVHHREVTYALALPSGPPWQIRGDSWIRRMHGIFRDVFASFGIATELSGQEQKRGEVLCFQHHTPDDLVLGNDKIVGSAQRRLRGALLQHGGILLAQSPFTPALPGVAELTGIAISPADIGTALMDSFCRATGWRLVPAQWSDTAQQQIDEKARTKYAACAWNDKH